MFEHILSIMIFLPLVSGLLLLMLPVKAAGVRALALAVSVIVLLCGIKVFADYSGSGMLEFVEKKEWISSLGISYHLGVDGISLFVLLTISVLFPLLLLVFQELPKAHYCNLLFVFGAMTGAVVAADLVVFYIFWELMLLPVFFLLGFYGGKNRVAATIKITIYTIAGSLCMLAALVWIAIGYHDQTGTWSFEIAKMAGLHLQGQGAAVAFAGMMLAFAIKIPIFPFHTWLPDAYTEAPTTTTFVLSAVMAKIGVYGAIRLVLPVFGPELARYGVILAALAVIGLIYCGLSALVQKDLKRLLAFSSASHMGIITVGVFCMNAQALTGTLYQIMAHATSTGVLFLFVELLEQRTGSRQIDSLGGVAYRAPILATFFAVAMLASCGLPGTSGFIGEFLIILGAVKFNVVIGVLAGTTLIIGVCYMLWMFQRVFFVKTGQAVGRVRDFSAREVLLFAPVIVLIVLMGILPQPFIAKVESTVENQIQRIDRTAPVHYVDALSSVIIPNND